MAKNRKYDRNRAFCKTYRAEDRRSRNRARRAETAERRAARKRERMARKIHLIQKRRAAAGKLGIARAVRRYLRHLDDEQRSEILAQLPVNWPEAQEAA